MDRFRQRELVRLAPGEFGISHFAMQVVAILLGDTTPAEGALRADVVDLFVRGVRTGDPADLQKLLSEMRRARISAEAAVDHYIPAAVARIGAMWHSDAIDVLEATVATTRLQSLLRELGRAWSADVTSDKMVASVLVVVPEGEQHILGAMIATTQLRRLGVSVCMQLVPTQSVLEELLVARRFNAVFVSVGNHESVELARVMIRSIRKLGQPGLPVAVGGPIPMSMDELREITGADHAGRDVKLALTQLGVLEPADCT